MKESIRIHCNIDGADVAIGELTGEGLVFGSESSARARGFSVTLQPATPSTEFRLRRVRMIQDWQPGEFHLKLRVEGGALALAGVDDDSLPEGRYSVRVGISDLDASNQPAAVEVPFSGEAALRLQFKSDRRRCVLSTPVAEFDAKILRVVGASSLDGEPVADWLLDEGPRARRKACLLNVLAKLRAARGAAPKAHLIDEVESVYFGDVDRVYARVGSGLAAQLATLAADPGKPFFAEGSPKAAVHWRLLAGMADADDYRLLSYRQEGGPALQSVVAVRRDGDPAGAHFAEFDIDLGNPLQDLAGAAVHVGELLAPGKTDHLKLRDKLTRGAAGDFVYYKVAKAK